MNQPITPNLVSTTINSLNTESWKTVEFPKKQTRKTTSYKGNPNTGNPALLANHTHESGMHGKDSRLLTISNTLPFTKSSLNNSISHNISSTNPPLNEKLAQFTLSNQINLLN